MVLAQMFEQEALVNLLDRQGLLRQAEGPEEIRRLPAGVAQGREA